MAMEVSDEFIAAMKSSKRIMDVKIRIRNKEGSIRYGPSGIDLIDGEVQVDWSNRMDGPIYTLNLTVADEERNLDPDLAQGDANNIWFSTRVDVRVGLWTGAAFEYCPVFRGWVEDVIREGPLVTILGGGKEIRHLPPWIMYKTKRFDAGTKWSQAIIDLINHRSIANSLIDIEVKPDDEEMKRNFAWGLGDSPWEIMQEMANNVDRQLFFRANGDIKLRDWPTGDEYVWDFKKGNESIVLGYPEQRFSMNDFRNTVYVLSERVVRDGPQTATRPEPVVGYATLPPGAALSAETLSVNAAKQVVHIANRPNIRTFFRANTVADSILSRKGISGLEAEIGITCVPLYHLEPGDTVKLRYGNEGIDVHNFRLKRFNIPLTPDGEQNINWIGRRKPDHKRKKKFGPRKGRRERARAKARDD